MWDQHLADLVSLTGGVEGASGYAVQGLSNVGRVQSGSELVDRRLRGASKRGGGAQMMLKAISHSPNARRFELRIRLTIDSSNEGSGC